jgi:uncharacterized DUF497 family protein
MEFSEIECSTAVAEKLWAKHAVDLTEVDQVLTGEPLVKRAREGLYYVLGRTEGGRYLALVVRDLGRGRARLVTARDMEPPERRAYRKR